MTRPPPPLNLIRSFEAAARHMSFTRAADELGYTQAAISTHVRALENYVGRKLFVRRARSLALTEIGEAFLPTLRQGLDQIDRATEAVAAGSRGRSLALACPVSLAQAWLPGRLVRFQETHPEIEVLVHCTVWGGPGDDIADVEISVHRADAAPAAARPLREETLALVAAPDIARRLSAPDDLEDAPLIGVAGRQDMWPVMCGALGLFGRVGRPMLGSNSSVVALEMAAAGLGVAVVPAILAGPYLVRGQLVQMFDAAPPSPWGYFLRTTSPAPGPSVRLLVDTLMESPE